MMNQSFNLGCAHRRLSSLLMVCMVLWPSLSRAQTHEDPQFAQAMAYVEDKNWPKAQALLEKQLAENENLHRARVELALVYASQNKIEQALTQLDRVLKVESLPANVRANLYRIRQRLDEKQQQHGAARQSANEHDDHPHHEHDSHSGHSVKSYIEVSAGYDDNVRYSSDDYFLQDNPFQDGVFVTDNQGNTLFVAPDGFIYDSQGFQIAENNGLFDLGLKDPKNAFYESAINFDHTYLFGFANGLKWYNNLNILGSENAKFEQHNKLQVKMQSGLNWKISEQLKGNVEVLHRLLKRNGQIQVRGTKISPSVTYYNQYGSWELGVGWQRRTYENAVFIHGDFASSFTGFETINRSVSVKWSNLFWDNQLLLLTKVELQDSNASDGLNNKGVKASAALAYSFNQDWRLLFSVSRLLREYKTEATAVSPNSPFNPQVVFNQKREDRSLTLKSRLSYDINPHWQLFLSGERGVRRSAIYNGISSDKTQFKLGVRLSF